MKKKNILYLKTLLFSFKKCQFDNIVLSDPDTFFLSKPGSGIGHTNKALFKVQKNDLLDNVSTKNNIAGKQAVEARQVSYFHSG